MKIFTDLFTDVRSVVLLGLVLICASTTSFAEVPETSSNLENQAAIVSAININTASAEELAEALVGVGLKRAEAIIEYRATHGPFQNKAQLMDVKGIGEVTLEKNKAIIEL